MDGLKRPGSSSSSPSKAVDGLERFAHAKADIRKAFKSVTLSQSFSTISFANPSMRLEARLDHVFDTTLCHLLSNFKWNTLPIYSTCLSILQRVQDGLRNWFDLADDAIIESFMKDIGLALQKTIDMETAVARDAMKVVFVGLTSAGKSTTINAILHSKVLPSGFGQTTSRFINLYPTKDSIAKLVDPVTGSQHNLNELDELANALSDFYQDLNENDGVGSNSVEDISQPLNLYWPSAKCDILKNDIVILDSPGLRFNKKFDDWIDNTASDADVFVLVVNGEMALGREATEFFQQVRRKFTRPNVFVLFNRWELAPQKGACARIKKQLLHLAKRLLVDTLQIVSEEELSTRVFFVSSKETLDRRADAIKDILCQKQVLHGDHLSWDNDEHSRLSSFVKFEELFALATSHHAINTRFSNKVVEGCELVHQCEITMGKIVALLEDHLNAHLHALQQSQAKFDNIQARLPEVHRHIQQIVSSTPDQIYQTLSAELDKVLREQLPSIVKDFSFLSDFEDGESIELEKQELSTYLEERLQVDLSKSCAPRIQSIYKEAINGVLTVARPLLFEKESTIQQCVRSTFRHTMTLDCSHLPQDFQADLHFHFSWGWRSIGALLPEPVRFALESVGSDILQRVAASYKMLFQVESTLPLSSSSSLLNSDHSMQTQSIATSNRTHRILTQAGRFAFDVGYICWDITTNTPYGLVGAATLPYFYKIIRRPWIRNIIMYSVFIYTSVYAYEYMSFTTAAKEIRFRNQFTKHAQERLKVTVSSRARDAREIIHDDLEETARNCLDHVRAFSEELNATTLNLTNLANEARCELEKARDLKHVVGESHRELQRLHTKYFTS
eukprot:gene4907-6908_t